MDVQKLSENLQGLVDSVDSKNPLAEPVPDAQLNGTIDWIQSESIKNVITQPLMLELAAKKLLHDYSANNIDIDHVCKLLDYALYWSEKDVGVEPTMVHNLIEEALDIETIGWCKKFWAYMESREARLCKNLVGNRSPGLTLIRYCNKLMRRLSKNQHAQFSGTVAMFLARAFPLNEKSGLNIRGGFDTDNVTTYETASDAEVPKDKDAEGDQVMSEAAEPQAQPEVKSKAKAEEDELYYKFWSLQDAFMDPTQLFSKPAMDKFKTKLSAVLAALKKGDVNNMRQTKRERGRDSKQYSVPPSSRGTPAPSETAENSAVFVPKWLTRRNLFELQMNDVSFRRTILAQILILCDFFLRLRQEAKDEWTNIKAVNKSVMFSYTLPKDDVQYFQKTLVQIRDSDFNSIDLANSFRRTLNIVSTSDKFWQEWKLRSCPSFILPVLERDLLPQAGVKLEENKKPRKRFWHAMGTPALTKAWKIPTGIELLEDNSRFHIPNAEEHYYKQSCELNERKKLLKDMLEDEATENKEEVKEQLDQLVEQVACVNWRGLRAARGQGHWVRFGSVDRKRGFAGLFLPAEEETEDNNDAKEGDQNQDGETAGDKERNSQAPEEKINEDGDQQKDENGRSAGLYESGTSTPAMDNSTPGVGESDSGVIEGDDGEGESIGEAEEGGMEGVEMEGEEAAVVNGEEEANGEEEEEVEEEGAESENVTESAEQVQDGKEEEGEQEQEQVHEEEADINANEDDGEEVNEFSAVESPSVKRPNEDEGDEDIEAKRLRTE